MVSEVDVFSVDSFSEQNSTSCGLQAVSADVIAAVVAILKNLLTDHQTHAGL